MANVNIKFNGKDFLLSCEDGQEEHLEELSLHLNNRFDNLKKSLGNIGENKLLLIASISVMDEYFETRKKIEEQKNQINKITDKFKELRSLVYGYKDDKEKEISNISEDQLKLKNELETHRISYETLVDKATLEIENFIKKHDTDTNVQ
jgi:cell division protein ZapA